jgi:hypothetical protein
MPIQLTLDPSLQISSTQFAAAWNADPRTVDLATAEVSSTAGADVGERDVVLLRTAQTAMPVGAAALYDLIQDILLQQGVAGPVQIAQGTTPDGGDLLTATAAADSMSQS